MKKKWMYGWMVLLALSACNRTEKITKPLNPLLKTNGLYVAVKPGAYSFGANHINPEEAGGVIDIIRFYPTGGGIMITQEVPKGFVINADAVKEWYINFETLKKKYEDPTDTAISIQTHMFTPDLYQKDSINFTDFITKTKHFGTNYCGKIYSDSLSLSYVNYISEKIVDKIKSDITLAPPVRQVFKLYACE